MIIIQPGPLHFSNQYRTYLIGAGEAGVYGRQRDRAGCHCRRKYPASAYGVLSLDCAPWSHVSHIDMCERLVSCSDTIPTPRERDGGAETPGSPV